MHCQKCGTYIVAPRPTQAFCSSKCRIAAWNDLHPRKGMKPKRIRKRERERLYTIIHKGETIEQLRAQAIEAARIQVLRGEDA